MSGGRTGVLALVALLAVAGCVGGVGQAGDGVARPADTDAAADAASAADAAPAAVEVATGANPTVDGAPDADADCGADDARAQAAPNATAGTTTVRAAAVGTVAVEPDEALLRVAVTATAPNATVVRDRLAANASSMRAALADVGVAADEVRTVTFDVRREHPDRDDGPVRFRGVHAFEITVTNVSRVGTVLDAAVTGGATEVDDVAFTLAEATRREARRTALEEAMADARADAETVAAAEGLAVVGVRSISTGETDVGPVRFGAAAATADRTEVSPGPVTVTARVEVVYDATATGG